MDKLNKTWLLMAVAFLLVGSGYICPSSAYQGIAAPALLITGLGVALVAILRPR